MDEWLWQNVLNSRMVESWNNSTQILLSFFLYTTPTIVWYHAKRNWKSWVCSRSKFGIYQFFEKQRHQTSAHFWWFICQNLKIWGIVDMKTAGRHRGFSTIYIKQLFPLEQTRTWCWVKKHTMFFSNLIEMWIKSVH